METINHEAYISFEVAKLLKEAGFDWVCRKIHFKTGWKGDNDVWEIEDNHKNHRHVLELDYCLLAPTIDVAQRWLRETYHLHITIFSSSQESWMFRITKPHQKLEDGIYGEDYYTYEEALESGIKAALEIILEK